MKIRGFSVRNQDERASVLSVHHRQSGFSLFEVLLCLILLTLGTALSIPTFQAMSEQRHVAQGAEQIVEFVNSSQNEAKKQQRAITFSYRRSAAYQWCIGAVTGFASCDCTVTDKTDANFCVIDTKANIISSNAVQNTDLLFGATADSLFSFDPLRGVTAVLSEPLVVAVSSDSGKYLLDLNVSNTGRMSICSKNADHAVADYAVCQP